MLTPEEKAKARKKWGDGLTAMCNEFYDVQNSSENDRKVLSMLAALVQAATRAGF